MAKREAKGAGARTSRLGELNALGEQPGVDAVGEVALRLLHQLAHDQHRRRGAVAGDIVLRRGNARDHHGRRVLNLHLVQQRVAVLGQLDVAGAGHEHLERALGSEVGLQHVLKAASRLDVHLRCDALLEDLSVGVDHLRAIARHGRCRGCSEACTSVGKAARKRSRSEKTARGERCGEGMQAREEKQRTQRARQQKGGAARHGSLSAGCLETRRRAR